MIADGGDAISRPSGRRVHQLVGGLRAGMGFAGARAIDQRQRVRLTRITTAGLRESQPHDITHTLGPGPRLGTPLGSPLKIHSGDPRAFLIFRTVADHQRHERRVNLALVSTGHLQRRLDQQPR